MWSDFHVFSIYLTKYLLFPGGTMYNMCMKFENLSFRTIWYNDIQACPSEHLNESILCFLPKQVLKRLLYAQVFTPEFVILIRLSYHEYHSTNYRFQVTR